LISCVPDPLSSCQIFLLGSPPFPLFCERLRFVVEGHCPLPVPPPPIDLLPPDNVAKSPGFYRFPGPSHPSAEVYPTRPIVVALVLPIPFAIPPQLGYLSTSLMIPALFQTHHTIAHPPFVFSPFSIGPRYDLLLVFPLLSSHTPNN